MSDPQDPYNQHPRDRPQRRRASRDQTNIQQTEADPLLAPRRRRRRVTAELRPRLDADNLEDYESRRRRQPRPRIGPAPTSPTLDTSNDPYPYDEQYSLEDPDVRGWLDTHSPENARFQQAPLEHAIPRLNRQRSRERRRWDREEDNRNRYLLSPTATAWAGAEGGEGEGDGVAESLGAAEGRAEDRGDRDRRRRRRRAPRERFCPDNSEERPEGMGHWGE